MKKYDDTIRKQLDDGIIEIAKNNNLVIHYLSTTGENVKVRIVLEGCAKGHSSRKSLNDCLYRGPKKVANLCGYIDEV